MESFNGRLRDEFLAVEQFDSLLEAQVLIEDGGSSTTRSARTAAWAGSPRLPTPSAGRLSNTLDSHKRWVSQGGPVTAFVTVNPVNDPPSFAAQTPARSVAQTAQAGDPVGATDVDNEPLTLTYSLSEPGASFFEIEAHTGQITVGPGTVLDAANQPTHTVSVTATVTEGAAPPIISGGGGGGGGGGPTGPTPSDIDFEWNVKRDLEKLDTDHGSPTGAVGRLSGTRGAVWQYAAIDVASAYTWAELHTTPRNPSAKWTAHLALPPTSLPAAGSSRP